MRALLILVGLAALALVGAWSIGLITVNQSKVAQVPHLSMEGGQAPAFTVNMATVEIGTENKTIEVPTVSTATRTISIPTVSVEKPAKANTNLR